MITLQKHNLTANIKSRYAITTYSFMFENKNKNGSEELRFELTIDPDAFISKFEAKIDGQLFIGETKRKKIATKEYKAAKRKNENAILISQPYDDIPNIFQIKTNIDSGSKISLEINIEQYLKQKFDFNELCIQILRNWDCYNINDECDNIAFQINIFDESGIYDISIPSSNNNMDKDKMIHSTTHKIMINEKSTYKMNKYCLIKGVININDDNDEGSWRQYLKIGDKIDVKDDRKWYKSKIIDLNESVKTLRIHYIGYDSDDDEDIGIYSKRLSPFGSHTNKSIDPLVNELTIKYKIKGESQQSHILFDNKSNTFAHIISNIIDPSDDNIIPRRVIFVIDKSGSMIGSKWNKTVSATIMALKTLRNAYDRFNIIVFDNYTNNFTEKMCITNEINIEKAIHFIEEINVGGGTNIDKPLKEAINIINVDINDCLYMNQIIFITDGEVSNTKNILKNVRKLNNSKISIFTFGVGQDENDSGWIKDVNHSFLKSLAVNNNGFYKRIKESNTDNALKEYFGILSKPILSNIKIEYNNKNIRDLTETKFNCLYLGNDIIITGKLSNNIKDMKSISLSATIKAITGHSTKKKIDAKDQNDYIKQYVKEMKQSHHYGTPINTEKSAIVDHIRNIQDMYDEINFSKINRKLSTNNSKNQVSDNYNFISQQYMKEMKHLYVTPQSAPKHFYPKPGYKIFVEPMEISKKITVNIDMNGVENDNTERIWAYLKLQQISRKALIHQNDMIEMDDDEEKEEESLAMELAMKYKFVTPWTSMIVVKEKQNEEQSDTDSGSSESEYETDSEEDDDSLSDNSGSEQEELDAAMAAYVQLNSNDTSTIPEGNEHEDWVKQHTAIRLHKRSSTELWKWNHQQMLVDENDDMNIDEKELSKMWMKLKTIPKSSKKDSTETRIVKEFMMFELNHDHSICDEYIIIENMNYPNIYEWNGMFIGPIGTPYINGKYRILIIFPRDYPSKPPKIIFLTKIYNSSVKYNKRKKRGLLRLPKLFDKIWSKKISVRQYLNAVYEFIFYYGGDHWLDPMNLRVSREFIYAFDSFIDCAYQWNLIFAKGYDAGLNMVELNDENGERNKLTFYTVKYSQQMNMNNYENLREMIWNILHKYHYLTYECFSILMDYFGNKFYYCSLSEIIREPHISVKHRVKMNDNIVKW